MLCPYHKCNNEQSDVFIYRSTIECCSGFRKINGERTGKYLEEMSLIRFSTISVRLVYIKMINYRGSILANLIKQCSQKNMQRKNSNHIEIETRFTKNYFLWWEDL